MKVDLTLHEVKLMKECLDEKLHVFENDFDKRKYQETDELYQKLLQLFLEEEII